MSVQLLCKWGTRLGLFECEDDTLVSQFGNHVADYGLSYGTQEEFHYRFQLFAAKDKVLNEINANPENTFTVGHNRFSTWTDDEYKRLLGLKYEESEEEAPNTVWLEETYAATIDWRTKGVVNAVKNQGQCGSCWAFSAVSAVESHHAMKSGTLYSLSEQ